MEKVTLIEGGAFTDARGTLRFVNDFDFGDVKRFYQVVHPDEQVVRAWQGHKIEKKYFYVSRGKFALAWVKIDNWNKPSADLEAEYVILKEDLPAVLCIPPGYANGIKALEKESILMVYSNLELQQSGEDRWSFDASLWLDWNKI